MCIRDRIEVVLTDAYDFRAWDHRGEQPHRAKGYPAARRVESARHRVAEQFDDLNTLTMLDTVENAETYLALVAEARNLHARRLRGGRGNVGCNDLVHPAMRVRDGAELNPGELFTQ